jgi:hypothetical protein
MSVPRLPALALIAISVAIVSSACGAPGSRVADVIAPTHSSAVGSAPRVTTEPLTVPRATAAPANDPAPVVRPSPASRAAATPAPTPKPPRKAFAMNLYRKGDYVAQFTFEWCVGASLQMALNMATDASKTSRANQKQLWEMAQARSSSPFGGANPRGWTAALNDLGIGPYELVSIPKFRDALQVAVHAIRETKRPVGLVMWRGRHAWVMSGFESIGDPRIHDEVKVTGIRVLDPLYPYGSGKWGPSPRPNALVSPATLARQFVIRDRGRANLGVPPGYLLVLPVKTQPGSQLADG